MRPIEILLVEDSPTDRLIAVEALQQAKMLNSLNSVGNGVEALAYLRREGKFAAAQRPDLILLDLNLPRMDGREVLREIKRDPLLKQIPVVVLTTSKADEDVAQAYGNHANSYITKPVDFPRFTGAIRALENYWFEVVTLPPTPVPAQVQAEPGSTASLRRCPPERGQPQAIEVLLAEDNPADVLMIRHALAGAAGVKFNLTPVTRMSELRECLRTGFFDVVLIDLGLPDSQGLDTYRQARAGAGDLPILVLTGMDDEALGLGALQEGAQEYLVKGQLVERSLARALCYAIEKKRIEERLRQAQKMEAIGQLAAGVAHDFNNLLTVIQGQANLLLEEPTDEELADSAKDIQAAAERAANLTRQLLTFSRQQVMKLRPLDLNLAVGNIGKMLRRILGEDVRLELQLAGELPPVEADLGMMEQVVLNLAVNARDAMPGGGKLTVQTSALELSPETARRHSEAYAGQFVRLAMSDTGCGMSAAVMARMFEPFFTTKEVGQGTGLGLATVFAIVQRHRGWIEVHSREGVGTLFELFFPVALPQPAVAPAEARAGRPPGGSETILVVEDEESVRRLAKRALARQGYRVLVAASGPEALAVWETDGDRIDLLLTDMVMPDGMTGRQLAERLRATSPGLKVVYASGYSADFLNADLSLEAGVNFLPKPYDIDELARIVRSRLDAAAAPRAGS